MPMTLLVILSPVLTLAGVVVGYVLGRRDLYRYVQPIAPFSTTMPTDITEPTFEEKP